MSRALAFIMSLLLISGLNLAAKDKDKDKDKESQGGWLPITQQDLAVNDRRKAGLSYAGYEISSVVEDRQLITRRKLRFEGSLMPLEKYEELRNFFSVVQKGDGDQAVLRPESEIKAQSQN
jgi:hypothetical protein